MQAAWHRWVWPTGTLIRGIFYSGDTLYLYVERGNTGVFLESMDVGDALRYGLTDRIRMDRQCSVTFTYDEGNDLWTSSVLPWTPTHPELLECVITEGWPSYIGGAFLFDYDAVNNVITTNFDLGQTTAKGVIGQMYQAEFEPTPVVIRDSQDRVSYIDVPVVGLVHLNLDKYPDFSVRVTNNKSGRVRTALASNRLGGARNNIVGYVQPAEGVFRFPLRALSTDVAYRMIVLSPHTFQLRDIEWEGSYNPTKRRV